MNQETFETLKEQLEEVYTDLVETEESFTEDEIAELYAMIFAIRGRLVKMIRSQ